MAIRNFLGLGILSLLLLHLGGCCCSCGGNFPPPNFTLTDGGSDGGDDSLDVTPIDPNEDKETQDARLYAQEALSRQGYGEVKTVTLQKNGTDWYVTGRAAGFDGADVTYNVWFKVTTQETDRQIKTTWAPKTITIDDEVVYP